MENDSGGSIISVGEMANLFGEGGSAPAAIFVDRAQLANALRQTMAPMSTEQIVALITNPFMEIMEYVGLVQGGKCCQKTSLLFNPHRLEIATKSGTRSIAAALREGAFYSGLSRASTFKNGQYSDSELLYQVMQLGVNGASLANEFPPYVARDVCLEYGLSRASCVLDPCAGWGGRMLGASCVADNYTCFEPSRRTADGLSRLAEFIGLFFGSFAPKVYNLAFEDAMAFGRYDLALTSPPYFDTECYSSDPGDSATRYRTLEIWRENFFVPLIDRTMMQLRPGAPFILNIGDRKYPLSRFMREHCDGRYKVKKLKNYLSGKAGLGKEGTEGEQFYEITNL